MARNLDYVFRSVGVWSGKPGSDYLIYGLSRLINKIREVGRPGSPDLASLEA